MHQIYSGRTEIMKNNLTGAATHTELHIFTTCMEGDKYLFPPEDLEFNPFVEGQVDGVQDGRNTAKAAPGPLPQPATIRLQTPTDWFIQVQPATEHPHAESIHSIFVYASVAEVLPYASVAVITFCPAIRVEYGSGCFTGGAAVIIHNAHLSSVFCIHDSNSKRTRRITDVESIRFTTLAVAIEQPNTCVAVIRTGYKSWAEPSEKAVRSLVPLE